MENSEEGEDAYRTSKRVLVKRSAVCPVIQNYQATEVTACPQGNLLSPL